MTGSMQEGISEGINIEKSKGERQGSGEGRAADGPGMAMFVGCS